MGASGKEDFCKGSKEYWTALKEMMNIPTFATHIIQQCCQDIFEVC